MIAPEEVLRSSVDFTSQVGEICTVEVTFLAKKYRDSGHAIGTVTISTKGNEYETEIIELIGIAPIEPTFSSPRIELVENADFEDEYVDG